MSAISRRVEILEDSVLLSSMGEIERGAFIKKVEMGVIGDYELVVEYDVFELLMVLETPEEKMLEYLLENVRGYFESLDKYDFDLIVAYIYKTGRSLKKGDLDYFAKKIDMLSFVTKELLFDLEKIELDYLQQEGVFERKFNIDGVLLDLEGENVKKQENK